MFTFTAKGLYSTRLLEKARELASGKSSADFLALAFGWLPVIAAAWFLARACALALTPIPMPVAAPHTFAAPPPERNIGSALAPFAHFSALTENNIFNLNTRAPVIVAPVVVEPPPRVQTLNATIMGTVEAPLPRDSRVILRHQGVLHVMRPGEILVGFTLREVRRGTAIFESSGRKIEITADTSGNIPQPRLIAALEPEGRSADSGEQLPLPPPGARPPLPIAAASVAVPGLSGALASDADERGLVVRHASTNLILRAMNLRMDDVLTSVNGKPATIMTDSQQMMQELASGSLTVSLLRDGRAESVTLRITSPQ